MLTSTEIREQFLAFFERHGHKRVASSSLVLDDPTLMFTNAGMVQFKDVFLGFDHRPYDKAVTSQRCLRAGGKHNDLENVGYTARHHTFFEMLGNFSFGDYFKRDAIALAWDLLTSAPESGGYGLAREHLWVTVFGGGKIFGADSDPVPADDAAYDLWVAQLQQAGFSEAEAHKRVTKIPTTDNFWMMGDTGPCGPCSEVFYNRDSFATEFEGEDEAKADSCVEIWNLVFMQYNRDNAGVLTDLPAPCVDTGMGLERLCAVLQGVDSNYRTDLFVTLLKEVNQAVAAAGGKADADSASLRVIADHIRAAAYLVADKILPSNEGRGYVLRRIIRRALRHGHQLGATQPFFASLAAPLSKIMGDAHPELPAQLARVTQVLEREEERFTQTLSDGMRILTKATSDQGQSNSIAGATAFKLYDTYGFPLDLTVSYARDNGMEVDLEGFEQELAEQRERSRAASGFKADLQAVSYDGPATEFQRDPTAAVAGEILALYDAEGKPVEVLSDGSAGMVVLSATSFYGEAGGQVGDQGDLRGDNGEAQVNTTVRLRADVHGHAVQVRAGELELGAILECAIDQSRRAATCRAHSATHLLHEALRRRLGDHVEQRGSLVEGDRLRFDFAHDGQLSDEDLQEVEDAINQQVLADAKVVIEELPYDDAIAQGARALFGEKYGDVVRMVQIDKNYSIELCGGTHVGHASQVGLVQLEREAAIAAGIRRVEAHTGLSAARTARSHAAVVTSISQLLKVAPENSAETVRLLNQEFASLLKKNESNENESVTRSLAGIKDDFEILEPGINDLKLNLKFADIHIESDWERINSQAYIAHFHNEIISQKLSLIATTAAANLGSAAVLAMTTHNTNCLFAVCVSKELQDKLPAKEWFARCSAVLPDVKGGGGKARAHGGGHGPVEQHKAALAAAKQYANEQLGS